MDKIEIYIVGRDPDGVINATEIRIYYKGKQLRGGWDDVRTALLSTLRQWSKEILRPDADTEEIP